jgi:hypothetical protein
MEIPEFFLSPFEFNDFDVHLARPLGRLGASRPPAAGEGIPEEANPSGNLRNSSLRCQVLPLIQKGIHHLETFLRHHMKFIEFMERSGGGGSRRNKLECRGCTKSGVDCA